MHANRERDLQGAVSGIVAVGAGVAAGELAALAVSPFASPYQAVAAFLVDHAPAVAREFAIEHFGVHDKDALMIGLGAAIVVLAPLAGVLQVRRRPLGLVVILGFVAFALAAVLTRPTVSALYVVPPLTSGIVAAAVLLILCAGAAPRTDTDTGDPPGGWTRRRFIGVVAVFAGASAVGVVVARQVARAGGVVAERMRTVLPTARSQAPPIPPGTELTLDGATSFMTDNASFYRIDTALQVPQLSTADWRLRIHGMVDRERTLGWDDLMAMPTIERIVTLTCVSNEVGGDLAGNARWLGVPMAEILSRVGVHDDADMLLSTSVDGWTSGTPISAITDGRDAMLAIGMNGRALPLEHGYPVRQLVPGLYGFVSACKWVVDWEVTRFDRAQSYWTQRGWGCRHRSRLRPASIGRPRCRNTRRDAFWSRARPGRSIGVSAGWRSGWTTEPGSLRH